MVEERENLRMTHRESASNHAELVAEAKSEQQVAMGLFVRQHSDEQDIKHVQSQLHINIAPGENSKQNMVEIAH